MLTTEMSPIIAAAQAGDTIVVRPRGGRSTTYKVRSVGGRKARELKLEGRRGSLRVLVDGGDRIWIREASARASDGAAHRRVLELRAITKSAPVPDAQLDGGSDVRACLRDMAIRKYGLPPGYDIELHPCGFQAYSHTDGEPVGEVQAHAWVAVCKCWQHHAEQAHRIAEAATLTACGLPPGYDVKEHSVGGEPRYLAVLDEPSRPVVSPCEREHAIEAIVDAWEDESAKFRKLANDRWDCIVDYAQAKARVLDRLPPGYTIEPGSPGFYRAVFDESGWVESGWVGAERESESEAVVDAWTHAHDRLLDTLKHRTTAIDRDVARGDASRCRRALQKILEIAKGSEPTGKELPSGEMPEQVAAEVGHALRIESKRRDWLSLAQPGLAWAVASSVAADKDSAP